ncbi:hypothetical protein TTHERM_01100470 (macronuclear) [Tetrahymena thermophila SB210]|uniref:Uncharacterized protein n=1 Tax=Tetrahymena thermophila (strain SB210) TaxID=312017 RepID=Q22BG5_TETTS|nr:hypothetical protein TTHERM_01100470 [Tetrahymena thermophila SB210]EAR82639.2 hypothetical protein TTHERM_01100470 [Tetrahymena thermophila SB210]|eukprot:XP_001030302.2 hypothetical protein TTHERM_01100470 [Tetrahymena thermophila SB210]
MQILLNQFMKVNIDEVVIEGFSIASMKNNNYVNFLSATNIDNLYIDSIVVQQNLTNCITTQIFNIIASEIQLTGYLIKAQNIIDISLLKVSLSGIYFCQETIFNLVNIQYASFKRLELEKIIPQLFQSTIFYIEQQKQLYYNYQLQIFYSDTQADLQSKQNLQFLVLNGILFFLQIEDFQVINGSSSNFGGCINFISQTDYTQSQVIISNSKFINCKSKYSGGAIAGIKQLEIKNSSFEKCSSQIGGALYMVQDDQILFDKSFFLQNKGYLVANNYNQQTVDFEIDGIYELINLNDDNQLVKVDKFLYPGLTYLIKISIKAEDEWYNTFSNANSFGNIYDLLINPSNNFLSLTPPQLLKINFPFLLWYAFDIPFNEKQIINFEPISINFVLQYTILTNQYKIKNGCKEQGMEQVFLENKKNQQFICKYCDQMKASYNGVCENCQTDYFSSCYGNYSMLKQSYWRSQYTVDPSNIYFCSNNPQSCQGALINEDLWQQYWK